MLWQAVISVIEKELVRAQNVMVRMHSLMVHVQEVLELFWLCGHHGTYAGHHGAYAGHHGAYAGL